MSSGPGDQSRIYHTADGGQHWQLQFTSTNPKAFFDSIAFWDPTHGIVLGDPIPDESGQLRFQILTTGDGKSWTPLAYSQLPAAVEGAGAFAASNTCISILPNDPNIWFATGGKAARVFHSFDRGQTWQVFDTPIIHGPDSAGIFSIAFRDPLHGVIAGGDYKHPDQDGPNLAFTKDGGKTWALSKIFSAILFFWRGPMIANPSHLPADRSTRTGRISVSSSRPPGLSLISAPRAIPAASARPGNPGFNSTR